MDKDILAELNRILGAKTGLEAWLTENNVTVPEAATVDELVGLLTSVSTSVIESGTLGQGVVWELYDNGVLVISGHGVAYGLESPFSGREDILYVVVKEGITELGDYVFDRCSMYGIILPDTLKKIGESTFNGCANLKSLFIPSSVNEIDTAAFSSCNNLKYVEICGSVTELKRWLLAYCVRLEQIVLPSSLIRIDTRVFLDCVSLETVVFKGSKSYWDSIEVDYEDDSISALLNAKLYCEYDSNADTVDGWHFAVRDDGTLPPSGVTSTITLVYTAGG